MPEEFIVLGKQPYEVIARRLSELGDYEAAQYYEARAKAVRSQEEGWFSPRRWLDAQHQYGFIAPFKPGSKKHHKIVSASNILADLSLQKQRINVHLDWFYVYEYPPPILDFGDNIHTILFTFEARNQIKTGVERVAFNQVYRAKSGQAASVMGHPIFIGLNMGVNGIGFSCKTVNVRNSSDKLLADAIDSSEMKSGLKLLTTFQPALAPFVGVAVGLAKSLTNSGKNVGVQEFILGLDFDTGASGARIAIGSYIVAQVSRPDELVWSDWSYDAETGTVVKTNLAKGEESYVLPYNAIIFRVSKYRS